MPPPHESLRASWGLSLSLRHSAAGIAALALEGTLGARLAEQVRMQTGHSPSPAEVRSWERSLPVLAQDLVRAGLDQVEVILEMRLPLSSKRIDAVLAGLHPKTRKPSYVVVELKQWSRASAWEGDPNLVTVDHAAGPRLHPVLQVRGYCDYLVDFTRSLHGRPEQVVGAAYLHNATSEGDVLDLFDLPADPHGRLFTAARRSAWLEFLQERLAPADGSAAADQLLNSAIAPSRQLLAVAAEEIRDREQFVLLAEQRLAHDLVLHAVRRAHQAQTRDHLHRCAARGKRTSGLVGSRSAVQSSRGHSG
jgi:hypothetical protein